MTRENGENELGASSIVTMGMSDCSSHGTVLVSVVDAWTVGAGVLMGTTIVEGSTGVDGMATRISC